MADMDVLDLLGQLVGKSLVALDVAHDRYHLLETVRQYALERLAQSDAEDQSRVKHLRYYVSLAQQAETGLSGPEQRSWHARLDSERENILLAHAYCRVAQGGGEAGLKLIRRIAALAGRHNFKLWHRVHGKCSRIRKRSRRVPTEATLCTLYLSSAHGRPVMTKHELGQRRVFGSRRNAATRWPYGMPGSNWETHCWGSTAPLPRTLCRGACNRSRSGRPEASRVRVDGVSGSVCHGRQTRAGRTPLH
jgi:hypothetical protein